MVVASFQFYFGCKDDSRRVFFLDGLNAFVRFKAASVFTYLQLPLRRTENN
jgi:hypothetical protein